MTQLPLLAPDVAYAKGQPLCMMARCPPDRGRCVLGPVETGEDDGAAWTRQALTCQTCGATGDECRKVKK